MCRVKASFKNYLILTTEGCWAYSPTLKSHPTPFRPDFFFKILMKKMNLPDFSKDLQSCIFSLPRWLLLKCVISKARTFVKVSAAASPWQRELIRRFMNRATMLWSSANGNQPLSLHAASYIMQSIHTSQHAGEQTLCQIGCQGNQIAPYKHYPLSLNHLLSNPEVWMIALCKLFAAQNCNERSFLGLFSNWAFVLSIWEITNSKQGGQWISILTRVPCKLNSLQIIYYCNIHAGISYHWQLAPTLQCMNLIRAR